MTPQEMMALLEKQRLSPKLIIAGAVALVMVSVIGAVLVGRVLSPSAPPPQIPVALPSVDAQVNLAPPAAPIVKQPPPPAPPPPPPSPPVPDEAEQRKGKGKKKDRVDDVRNAPPVADVDARPALLTVIVMPRGKVQKAYVFIDKRMRPAPVMNYEVDGGAHNVVAEGVLDGTKKTLQHQLQLKPGDDVTLHMNVETGAVERKK
jgi:hypothetical protein